ncbi:white collar 2 type of transcription factor [Rhodotorula sphaerocarpa]
MQSGQYYGQQHHPQTPYGFAPPPPQAAQQQQQAFPQQQQQHSPYNSMPAYAAQPQHGMQGYSGMYQQQQYAQPHHPEPLAPARESTAGPSRSTVNHRRDSSALAGQPGPSSASGASQSGSAHGLTTVTGQRHPSGPYQRPEGAPHTVKASSTTSLFTTRKNWSEHILQELQDFMHVLSPEGKFIFASESARELTGYSPDELFTRSIFDFIHADDVTAFKRDFETSCRTGDTLTLYYRFKTSDDRHVLFEVTGHPYYEGGKPQQTPDQPAKCFFATARPYPSKNQALLDSFLELKFENERLRQELLVIYKEVEGNGSNGSFPYGQPGMYRADSFDQSSRSVIDPSTGLVQTQALIPSTSNTYGALGIGISANGTKGDGTGEKKKKASPGSRSSGTVESPEWRKGPDGPKSLCNACGLRYAKLVSKTKKEQREGKK